MAKFKPITTPAGIANYPWLTKPDTKFNKNGVYKVDLVLEGEEMEAFKEKIDAMVEEAYEAKIKDVKAAKRKSVEKKYPYEEEFGDDDEPTGRMIFKFKQNAKIKTKDGSIKNIRINIFDAKGKPMKGINPYGGSLIKVAFTSRQYYKADSNAIGITLDLSAVQVIDLVTGSGGSASQYGFGAEEGGYEFSEEDAMPDDEEPNDEEEEEDDDLDGDDDTPDF